MLEPAVPQGCQEALAEADGQEPWLTVRESLCVLAKRVYVGCEPWKALRWGEGCCG